MGNKKSTGNSKNIDLKLKKDPKGSFVVLNQYKIFFI